MVDIGNFADVINAQNVTFQNGNDEFITLTDIELVDESVIDRTHPRDGALDMPSFSIIEISATITVAKAVYDNFRAMRQITTRGALPSASYKLVATSINPAGTSDFTETGTYIVRRMASTAPERGTYTTRVTLRLNNNNKLTES